MLSILRKPYPFIFNKYSYTLPAAVTFILILFLAPLGFSSIDFKERVVMALVISIIIAISIYTGVKTLKKVAPNLMSEEKWTVGKEFFLWLSVLFVITCAITLVFMCVLLYQYNGKIVFSAQVLFNVFSKTAYITIGISIIPMMVLILFEQNNHQKKQYKKAEEFSKLLKNQLINIQNEQKKQKNILLTSDTNDVELQVPSEDIIFIKSDGNYVEVFFNNHNTIQKKLIRNRLKNIEKELPNTTFFRCHNSFIVNGNHIINVLGNARNLVLELKNCEEQIPVSRSKVKAIDDFLKDL